MKNIIFDMDGVLIDSMPAHKKAWKKALNEHNIEIDDIELALQEGSNQKFYLNSILNRHNINLSHKEKEEIRAEKNRIFNTLNVRPYKIKKYLSILKKQGIKIGVGSGGEKYVLQKKLNNFFPNTFDAEISGDDVYRGKPFPETYNKAIKALGAKKEESLVIENAPLGVEAARRAGLTVYALTTTLPKKYLKNANRVFTSHEELFEYILNNIK
jgi:beta-phosphoglucomutase